MKVNKEIDENLTKYHITVESEDEIKLLSVLKVRVCENFNVGDSFTLRVVEDLPLQEDNKAKLIISDNTTKFMRDEWKW